MSNNAKLGGDGTYKGYEKQLELAKSVKAKCTELKKSGQMPKGFSFAIIALRAREQGTGNREQQTMKGFQNLEMS